MDATSPADIIKILKSNDESKRKEAAFRTQSLIGDPSWTDLFLSLGGGVQLQRLLKNETGNTLAYSLASVTNLLELDRGWDQIDQEIIMRLAQFIVGKPLVNILRGAMSILAAAVSHPSADSSKPASFGASLLDPALEKYPDFLDHLVSRLSSADHALCANALQLINAILRDAITQEEGEEWKKLIGRLGDLGAIKAVYVLMQSSGLQDLAQPLLEFQILTRVMLRKWRDIPINPETPEHRRALKNLYRTANVEKNRTKSVANEEEGPKKRSDPEQWRRLGFQTTNPPSEFEEVGYLGLMDLDDYVRKNEEGFRRLLLEQSTKSKEQRCPIAKASLAVTSILFDHFEIDRPDEEQQRSSKFDKFFKPMLLQWSRLHTSGLQAFFRLWASTGAEDEDFNKIEELVRILIEHVVGQAPRTRDVSEIEQELANYELSKLRGLQMELLELTHEDAWGQHLRQIKEDLTHEALQFMKEQRIRCLLQGAWFPNIPVGEDPAEVPAIVRLPSWRFVRLSHNRRYLHYSDFNVKPSSDPALDTLTSRIDINAVTEVKSDFSSSTSYKGLMEAAADDTSSIATYPPRRPASVAGLLLPDPPKQPTTTTVITLHGYANPLPAPTTGKPARTAASQRDRTPRSSRETNNPSVGPEVPLLTLHPTSAHAAAEWLDGLLMLLNQAPLTAETNKMVGFIARYGLKIRMLNVRFEEGGVGAGLDEWGGQREVEMPGRQGVEEEFYYEMGGEE